VCGNSASRTASLAAVSTVAPRTSVGRASMGRRLCAIARCRSRQTPRFRRSRVSAATAALTAPRGGAASNCPQPPTTKRATTAFPARRAPQAPTLARGTSTRRFVTTRSSRRCTLAPDHREVEGMKRTIVAALAALLAGCEEQRSAPAINTQQSSATGGESARPAPVVLNLGGQGANDAQGVASAPAEQPFAVVVRDADAGVDPIEADYPPLNVAAVERGREWSCVAAGCFRSAARCEARRSSLRDTGISTAECAPSHRAWCFSYARMTPGRADFDAARCSSEESGIATCRDTRDYMQRRNRIVTETRNISRCELVE
jgi:hypothetical protein